MLFSSLTFLYGFLPAVLMAYFLAPGAWKNGVLLLASLLFYAWGEPKYVLLMIGSILLFYLCGLAMGRAKSERGRRGFLILAIAAGVGLLSVFKYADFFIGSFNAAVGTSIPLLRLALPIGISFYTFQCMSYAVDVYRGKARPQKNLITFGAYVALFPQLIAGPIVRYTDVARELEHRSHSWEETCLGLRRFLFGLGKKVLLANQFAELTELYRASGEQSVLFCWMYAVGFALQLYFDFSGYSDMAIGLGRIFGFRFPENFDYPYLSRSVTEFWRRWHMTLGGWFRDYVYIPLGGSRVSRVRWFCNVLAVLMLTGLWHGAGWNFVLWGLLFAVLLLVEKLTGLSKKTVPVLSRVYVLLAVLVSFVIFNADSLGMAARDLRGMLCLGTLPLVTTESLYYFRSFAVLFLVGLLGATPLPKRLGQKLRWLEIPAMVGLLVLCTAYLVDGSFNPFLYFRF